MTSPFTVTITSEHERERAMRAVKRAPEGYRVTFQEPKRSDEQNRRLWAMLGEIADQVEYWGEKLDAESWKEIFTAALKPELKVVPSLDGKGIVQIGLRTSKMSVAEMSDLLALIEAYGATHGVVFKDEERAA